MAVIRVLQRKSRQCLKEFRGAQIRKSKLRRVDSRFPGAVPGGGPPVDAPSSAGRPQSPTPSAPDRQVRGRESQRTECKDGHIGCKPYVENEHVTALHGTFTALGCFISKE